MAYHRFRVLAEDDTQYWDPALQITKAFSLYLFKEGEATYCCSLTPSSWCEFLENDIQPYQDDLIYEGDDQYVGFIQKFDSPYISRAFEVFVDHRVFRTDEERLEEAWKQARDHDHPEPRIL